MLESYSTGYDKSLKNERRIRELWKRAKIQTLDCRGTWECQSIQNSWLGRNLSGRLKGMTCSNRG